MAATRLAWVFLDVPPDAHDAARLFWARVLGEQPVQDPDDVDYAFFPTPLAVRVGLQRIGDVDAGRVHLDLAADDVDAEARRLEDLGATRVRDVDDHVILRDPAGLLICVVPARWAPDAPLPLPDTNP